MKINRIQLLTRAFMGFFFLAFYHVIGVKAECVILFLIFEVCNKRIQCNSVSDLLGYHFPVLNLGCRGTTKWLQGTHAHFRALYWSQELQSTWIKKKTSQGIHNKRCKCAPMTPESVLLVRLNFGIFKHSTVI